MNNKTVTCLHVDDTTETVIATSTLAFKTGDIHAKKIPYITRFNNCFSIDSVT